MLPENAGMQLAFLLEITLITVVRVMRRKEANPNVEKVDPAGQYLLALDENTSVSSCDINAVSISIFKHLTSLQPYLQ